MREQFLGGFEDLGLGFSKKTKREAGEERERRKKMSETGSCEFLYRRVDRVGSDPTHSRVL